MNNTVEFYLSKGFDLKTSQYFAGGRKKVVTAVPNENFTLTLTFDNGEQRLYDVFPLLKVNTVFEPFMEWDNFKRIYVDENGCPAWDVNPDIDSTTAWNNKVNLCSDTCYLDSIPF